MRKRNWPAWPGIARTGGRGQEGGEERRQIRGGHAPRIPGRGGFRRHRDRRRRQRGPGFAYSLHQSRETGGGFCRAGGSETGSAPGSRLPTSNGVSSISPRSTGPGNFIDRAAVGAPSRRVPDGPSCRNCPPEHLRDHLPPRCRKTTLTEKFLLYGNAIHLAGAVKDRKNQRATTSDWMELERQRGISISSTVLQFDYGGYAVNLLDTPGHKDFSEDTYRVLTAVDAALMVIDAAKGVETQTRKLFEVCRRRGIPIFTFMNKCDRPILNPLALLDELEAVLGIQSSPVVWPLGNGPTSFRGVFDRRAGPGASLRARPRRSVPGPCVRDLARRSGGEGPAGRRHLRRSARTARHAGRRGAPLRPGGGEGRQADAGLLRERRE